MHNNACLIPFVQLPNFPAYLQNIIFGCFKQQVPGWLVRQRNLDKHQKLTYYYRFSGYPITLYYFTDKPVSQACNMTAAHFSGLNRPRPSCLSSVVDRPTSEGIWKRWPWKQRLWFWEMLCTTHGGFTPAHFQLSLAFTLFPAHPLLPLTASAPFVKIQDPLHGLSYI